MRRLTHRDRDDTGVVTLLMIGMIPVLLLAVAAGIDLNRYSQENSSAQHSADATALAVATDCASGVPLVAANFDQYRKGGQTISGETPISCGANQVRIKIEKDVNAGLILDRNARRVQKEAIVSWGTANSATTAPVVVSQCTFDLATMNEATKKRTYPSEVVIIPLGSGSVQGGGGNGGGEPKCPGRPPGAFGWLDTGLSEPCSITTALNADGQFVVHGNTGNGNVNPWNCITAAGVDGTITIPIYAAACRSASPCVAGQNDGVGNNTYYLLLGYAKIEVKGWNLQHGSPRTSGTAPSCPGPGSASCIEGRFVEFSTQLGSTGPASNFGVQVIYLSK